MKWFIQASAEDDIVRQIEWYAERGLDDVARRFREATRAAISALAARPQAGGPRSFENLRLTGLRVWPIKGFDAFRVYYLVRPELVTIVRVLHGRRDLGSILEEQEVDAPDSE